MEKMPSTPSRALRFLARAAAPGLILHRYSMQYTVNKIASFCPGNGGILYIRKAPGPGKNALSCSLPPTFLSPRPTIIPPKTHPTRPRQTPRYSYIPALKSIFAKTEHRTNTI